MLRLAVEIIGLEKGLLERVSAAEKGVYKKIVICYLSILLMATIAGAYLFYLINDHLAMILIGGLLFLGLYGSIFRVLIISDRTGLVDYHEGRSSLQRWTPSLSAILRLFFCGVFALLLSFPVTAALHPSVVKRVQEEKRETLLQLQRDGVQQLVSSDMVEDARHTHFPLAILEHLIASGQWFHGLPLVALPMLLMLFYLAQAQNKKSFEYEDLWMQQLALRVHHDYERTVDESIQRAEDRFDADLSFEREHLRSADMYPPYRIIPFPLSKEYIRDEETVRKELFG